MRVTAPTASVPAQGADPRTVRQAMERGDQGDRLRSGGGEEGGEGGSPRGGG